MINANSNTLPLVRRSSFAFRAAPGPGEFAAIVPGAGTTFYTPQRRITLVGLNAWADVADPFVPGGGATTVQLRIWNAPGIGANAPTAAVGIATWNLATVIAGRVGTGIPGATGALLDYAQGSELAPQGSIDPSRPLAGGIIAAVCDVGTVTGKLWVEFHFQFVNAVGNTLP